MRALASRPRQRIALVGETDADAREVMVEGVSGLLAIHRARRAPAMDSVAAAARLAERRGRAGLLGRRSGGLRGPQFDAAWCDELAKWRHAEQTWDMLQFGLRLGDRPRQVITTTPRPIPLLKRLIADPRTAVTRAATHGQRAPTSRRRS